MNPGEVPAVPAVPAGTRRPLWSVMIPTFNCADYLAATLTSVLAQDPGPEVMQIEVIDDCSTADRPEEVVADVGGGRVSFHRQPANVGISRNLTTCLHRSTGHLVHLLHGDDIVYPRFYSTLRSTLEAHPEAGGVLAGAHDIDEEGTVILTNEILRPERGVLERFLPQIFEWNPLRAPAVVARRRVYEQVGGFRPGLRFCADWDMWKRLATATVLVYEPQVLTGYRVHSRSDTARLGMSITQIREMFEAVQIGHTYLPGQTRAWSRKFYGTTRRWAWARLRDRAAALPLRDRAGYAELALESILRQQGDRLVSAARTATAGRAASAGRAPAAGREP
jgi:glycosyltransferase involved in cell wall biosynthesis